MSGFNTPIGKKNQGRDFNFFKRISVSNTAFGVEADGYAPDIIIKFPTVTGGVIFNIEGSGTIEYSFNGNTSHGELISGGDRSKLIFYNRSISMVWFRLKSGSGSVVVEAWSGA